MPVYVDSSVLVSALFDEEQSEVARNSLRWQETFYVSWLTFVEVRRRIATDSRIEETDHVKSEFDERLLQMQLTDIGVPEWRLAAEIAESTLLKSLDALHLAVASNLELQNLTFLTFDKKQAEVARQLGFAVVGA